MALLLFSIHLMCWLDLEQYRRTPREEKAVREERSMCIAARYLDRKYFFGPDSPATAEQQNDVSPLILRFQTHVKQYIKRAHVGSVTTPKNMSYCQLPGKASQRHRGSRNRLPVTRLFQDGI